jgi:phage tail-like protein
MGLINAVSGAIGLPIRTDPVLNHNFIISLLDTSNAGTVALSLVLDVVVGGFSECTGLEMTMKVEDYREGGNNGTVLKFPGRVEWSPITLKKGMGAGQTLWDWHYGFAEGKGKRRDGLIILLTDLHLPNNIWYFRDGLPTKYTGPAMNAGQNSVAIEAVEIVHQGIYQVPFVGYASAALGAGISAGVKALG